MSSEVNVWSNRTMHVAPRTRLPSHKMRAGPCEPARRSRPAMDAAADVIVWMQSGKASRPCREAVTGGPSPSRNPSTCLNKQGDLLAKSTGRMRSLRLRTASFTRSGKRTPLTRTVHQASTVPKEPSWPGTLLRGALFGLGKAAVEWLIHAVSSLWS